MIRTSHHYFRLLLLLLWSLLFRFLQLSVPPLQRHQQAWGVYYSGFNPIRMRVHANFSEPGSMCTQLKIRSVWKMNPESLNLDSVCTGLQRDTGSEIRARAREAAAQWLCRGDTQSSSGLSCSVISCFGIRSCCWFVPSWSFCVLLLSALTGTNTHSSLVIRTWSAQEVTKYLVEFMRLHLKVMKNDLSTCCAQYNTRRSQSGLSVKETGATRRQDPTPLTDN